MFNVNAFDNLKQNVYCFACHLNAMKFCILSDRTEKRR